MLIFLNHVLAYSKSLPTRELLMCHRSKLRGNTSWIQLLDASNSACPGTAIISLHHYSSCCCCASLLVSCITSLPTPVLPLARSTQCYLLVTVAPLALKQPQLLVWQGFNTYIQVHTYWKPPRENPKGRSKKYVCEKTGCMESVLLTSHYNLHSK